MKVEYNPWKKLEIKTYLLFKSVDEFADFVAAPAPLGMGGMTNVLWANGVVFRHTPLNAGTNPVAEEIMRGGVLWDTVEFAIMPKRAQELRSKSKASFTISTVDVSGNALFAAFAKWAKDVAKTAGE